MADLDFLVIGGLAALFGAIVQSSVGLGVGLVAAPVITLLYPSLMPGAILVAAVVLPLATLAKEVRHADLRGLAGRSAGGSSALRWGCGWSPRCRCACSGC